MYHGLVGISEVMSVGLPKEYWVCRSIGSVDTKIRKYRCWGKQVWMVPFLPGCR